MAKPWLPERHFHECHHKYYSTYISRLLLAVVALASGLEEFTTKRAKVIKTATTANMMP